MQARKPYFIFLLLPLLLAVRAAPCQSLPQTAQSRLPLVQEGKRSLYQRVISHPGAMLSFRAGEAGMRNVRAFTPFYVYSRQVLNGEEWLEVSPASSGAEQSGWLRQSQCSSWDKALTLMFTDRMGRDPVLFFQDYSALDNLVRAEDMRLAVDNLQRSASGPDSPVLASEPTDAAIPRKQFYLMPIFSFSDEYEQYNLRLLNVGVIDPGKKQAPQQAQYPAPAPAPKFSAGVAFIVDTTISMGPYIEQTKKFVSDAYDALGQSSIANDVSFAVVAYRNSTRHDARLEYVSSVVAPFTTVSMRASAEERLAHMAEATVSTHSFNEDAFAGIKAAVDGLDWSPYTVKVAVMITDAGAIRNSDPLSSTGLTEREMADLLAQKGIRLVVIHLQTAQGKRHNMPDVVNQYKQLTTVRDGRVKCTYIALPVQNAQVASQQFGRIATALVNILQKSVAKAAAGVPVPKPMSAAASSPEETAAWLGECLGYSAYLEFAGKRQQTAAPQLVQAWVADKDLNALVQGRPTDALMPAVLLNKHQLNTLARQIGLLVDAARASRSADSRGLFQRIVSLSSQTLRDPERLQRASGDNLFSQGLLPEFLEGLPYKSQVMNLTEARWIAMSAREQDELIYSLEAKMRLYAEYHNDTDNWVSFGAADPAEALYRVPLSSLP
ncbi:vWA domain-containing protein [Desulfovibrio sp. ZJ369]|uniref:vWA domain-containing protein n=1 Tax=Desulfovibrio sp. ZJ369 TaxID=2709793 RepID=UPI0013EAD741|nr:vWA domain-containing protein [Desulfovibrio sp. ZJ369]